MTQSELVHSLIQLEVIQRLHKLGSKALTVQLAELHASMDSDLEQLHKHCPRSDSLMRGNLEGDYLAHVNDEYIEISETLPNLHAYSVFLIAYSYFERTLNGVCASLRRNSQLPLAVDDLAGRGIIRAESYLRKVAGITSPFELQEWRSAKLFGEIRNNIAHRNGFVDYKPQDTASLWVRLTRAGFELRQETLNQPDGQIILTGDSVLTAISAYKMVLQEVGGFGRSYETPKHGLPAHPSYGA